MIKKDPIWKFYQNGFRHILVWPNAPAMVKHYLEITIITNLIGWVNWNRGLLGIKHHKLSKEWKWRVGQ